MIVFSVVVVAGGIKTDVYVRNGTYRQMKNLNVNVVSLLI